MSGLHGSKCSQKGIIQKAGVEGSVGAVARARDGDRSRKLIISRLSDGRNSCKAGDRNAHARSSNSEAQRLASRATQDIANYLRVG